MELGCLLCLLLLQLSSLQILQSQTHLLGNLPFLPFPLHSLPCYKHQEKMAGTACDYHNLQRKRKKKLIMHEIKFFLFLLFMLRQPWEKKGHLWSSVTSPVTCCGTAHTGPTMNYYTRSSCVWDTSLCSTMTTR